jgi:hypothetical protein
MINPEIKHRLLMKPLAPVLAASVLLGACVSERVADDFDPNSVRGNEVPTNPVEATPTATATPTVEVTPVVEPTNTPEPTATVSADSDNADSNNESQQGEQGAYDQRIIDALTVKDSDGFVCVNDMDDTAELLKYSDGDKEVVVHEGNKFMDLRLLTQLKVDSEMRSQDNRLYSDSIANPMEESHLDDKNQALREFQTTICESTEVTAMLEHYFANLEVGGVKTIELNPWLENGVGDASQINDRALELYNIDESATLDEIVAHNLAHQELAGKLATLLERFENLGIHDNITTTFNYHLAGGGLVAGDLNIAEIVENDVQYTGEFLVLRLTAKDGRCFAQMLINTDDQRVAEGVTDRNCEDVIITTPEPPKPPVDIPPEEEQPVCETNCGNPVCVTCGDPIHDEYPYQTGPNPVTIVQGGGAAEITEGYVPGSAEANEGSQSVEHDGIATDGAPTTNGTQIDNSAGTGANGPEVGQVDGNGNGNGVTEQPDPAAEHNSEYEEGSETEQGDDLGNSDPDETNVGDDIIDESIEMPQG